MGKPENILRSLGLAAGMLAGEGAMDAQTPKQAEMKQTPAKPEMDTFNPRQELNKLLKKFAPPDGAEQWLKAAENHKKSAQEEGSETSFGKLLISKAKIWELKYTLFAQLKIEVEFWEKTLKNPNNDSSLSEEIKVCGQTDLIFYGDIKPQTERAQRWEKLDPNNLEMNNARKELQEFEPVMKKFMLQMREYFARKRIKK